VRIFISLTFLVIILILFATPKTIWVAYAPTDIPLQDTPESNNNTENNTVSSNSGLEQMTIKAQLKPQSGWLADYVIKKFRFSTSDGGKACPSNNCEYRVQNGQFSVYGNSGYVLQGKLKVTTPEDHAKNSIFFRFILDKTGEQEMRGEKILTLEGRDGYGSDLAYEIPNATLQLGKNPVLTIHGERSPSENFTTH
jgi:hypothetical protein